jgi:hypothetical protein
MGHVEAWEEVKREKERNPPASHPYLPFSSHGGQGRMTHFSIVEKLREFLCMMSREI